MTSTGPGNGQGVPVLFEDAHLLVVDKPPGLPVHATVDPRRDHLEALVRRQLRARDGDAPVDLALVHRLDVDTTGVVVFAKTRDAARALGTTFVARHVAKRYLAAVHLLEPAPGVSWEDRNYLKPGVRGLDGRTRTEVVRSGGKPSRTSYQVLSYDGDRAMVEARPLTGRTHQIRAQLAHRGMPLLGDTLYGAPPSEALRPLLHAERLVFPHPATGRRLEVAAPVPGDLVRAVP